MRTDAMCVIFAIFLAFYFYSILAYPITSDEALFSAMGKSINSGAILYKDIIDNKGPGVYLVFSVFHYAGDSWFLLSRVVLALANIAAGFCIYLVSRKIFPETKKDSALLIIPAYLLCTIIFSGLVTLTESYSTLFAVAGICLFIEYFHAQNRAPLLAFSSILFFAAVMFNQSAVFFFAIPLIAMLGNRDMKGLAMFIGAQLILLLAFTCILEINGALDGFVKATITRNIGYISGTSPIAMLALAFIIKYALIGAVVISGLVGMYFAFSNFKGKDMLLLYGIAAALFILTCFSATKGIAYRHYLFGPAALLLIFSTKGMGLIMDSKGSLEGNASLLQKAIRIAFYLFIAVMLLFWLFVIAKMNGYSEGYDIGKQTAHYSKVKEIAEKNSCTLLYAFHPVYYAATNSEMPSIMTLEYFKMTDGLSDAERAYHELAAEADGGGSCFIDCTYVSFYYLPGIYRSSSYEGWQLPAAAYNECTCSRIEDAGFNSTICHSCKI